MEYKVKYNFIKNNKGQLVGQSIDGTNSFIMPIDLESEEVQKKLFKSFLHKAMEDVQNGQTIVEPTGEIRINQDSFNRMIKSSADVDEHVALAIADYMVRKELYGWSDESFVLLEAMNESILDKPELINKWILFYDHSIVSLDKAYKTCTEAVKIFNEKLSKLPNVAELAKEKAIQAKRNFQMLVEKEKQCPLTSEEKKTKEKASMDLYQYGTQYIELTEKERPLLEFMHNRMEYIQEFIDKTEITKAVMGEAKATLELGGSIDFNSLLPIINLSKVAGKITSGCTMFKEIDPSEITRENMQRILNSLGEDINDIDGLMDTATKEGERISEIRKKMETNSNTKNSTININIV